MAESKPPDTLQTHNPPLPPSDASPSGPPTLPPATPPTRPDTPSHPDANASTGPYLRLPSIAGYEILGELGRGGMGVVYQARQIGLNRLVAIKMLLPGAWTSPDDESRFRAEAEAIASLQHPHIVQVYQVGQVEGQHFFTLEYCPGGSLAARLKGRPLGPPVAAALVEKLADAVQAAHDAGIVHRDLKPANVLLLDEESDRVGGKRRSRALGFHPKITDFGLAKHLDNDRGQTRSGAIMGTPSYMAPEQASGQKRSIGPGTDVYALGAILYELLTGRPPFRGETLMETLDQVRKLDPVRPQKLQADVPADLEAVVLKCLEKLPRHRYPSANALADDLARWRKGRGVRARRMAVSRRAFRFLRRHLVAALAGVCVFLMVLLFVVGADLGSDLPGAGTVRRVLDANEISLLRPAPRLAALNLEAAALRHSLERKITERAQAMGYLPESLKPGPAREADAWSTAQTATSLFLSPDADTATCKLLLTSLDHTFKEFVPGFGWRLDFPRGHVSSAPTLWGLIAVAAAHSRPELIPSNQQATWQNRLTDIQTALEKYLAHAQDGTDTGGWNMYPNQRDAADASIYSTALALLGLLEMRRADLSWRDSPKRRDELLAAAVAWIVERFDGRGWHCHSLQENEFSDGLTIFLYALLQRAELETGLPLPSAVADAIPPYLAQLSSRPWSYPVSIGFFGSPFTDADGKVILDTTRQVRFMWYAWSIDATTRWLLRARGQRGLRAQVVQARRVLGHLLTALGTTAAEEAQSGFTYVAAETLLGLSAVQLPK